jgi:hypothetical protein
MLSGASGGGHLDTAVIDIRGALGESGAEHRNPLS